jgi:hypothetical protein
VSATVVQTPSASLKVSDRRHQVIERFNISHGPHVSKISQDQVRCRESLALYKPSDTPISALSARRGGGTKRETRTHDHDRGREDCSEV